MPISDIYTGSATVTVSSSSITPVASLVTASTKRAFIVGVRIGIGATAYTAGNCLFQLYQNTNTPTAGNVTNVYTPNDTTNSAVSALSTFISASTAYGTAPTGNVTLLWQQELPQTTGSSWEEFPPLGYEYTIKVSSGVSMWVTAAGTAASQTYNVEIVWSE